MKKGALHARARARIPGHAETSPRFPVQMSREKSRAEGVKRTVKWMVGFCVFYLIALMYLYPRLEGL
jgi:hypothetical protein